MFFNSLLCQLIAQCTFLIALVTFHFVFVFFDTIKLMGVSECGDSFNVKMLTFALNKILISFGKSIRNDSGVNLHCG